MVQVPLQINGQTIKLHVYLRKKLDNVKKILAKNWDAIILIDGYERSGKSTLGITCAWYLTDGKFKAEYFCKDTEDAIEKIGSVPDKSVLILDEGSVVMSSRDSMKKKNKQLQKILDVVGQKNLVLIIVLPSFFELAKPIATRRSRFLLHVYTDNTLTRGKFAYYGERKKKQLYKHGKLNFYSYAKPSPDWRGRFDDFNPFGEIYKKIKRETLISTLKGDDKRGARLLKQQVLLKKTKKSIYDNLMEVDWFKSLTNKQKGAILDLSARAIDRYSSENRLMDK